MIKKDINSEKEQLYLVFVNKIGSDVYGECHYEFVFSKDKNDVTGESWDSFPAQGNPQAPHKKYIEKVSSIKTDKFDLEVIQDSPFFSMSDCQNHIIALSWETLKDDDDEDFNNKRLVFYYGEQEDSVIDKLYSRNIKF